MSKAQFRVLMLLTVISGLVGGGLSDWLFRVLPARAAKATAAPEVIEAQEFRVVDNTGSVRGWLGTLENGEVGLGLRDVEKESRAVLQLLPDGSPSLRLFDAAGKVRVGLGISEDGVSGLSLLDAAKKVRIGLSVVEDGTPGLGLWDAAGEALWQAP